MAAPVPGEPCATGQWAQSTQEASPWVSEPAGQAPCLEEGRPPAILLAPGLPAVLSLPFQTSESDPGSPR